MVVRWRQVFIAAGCALVMNGNAQALDCSSHVVRDPRSPGDQYTQLDHIVERMRAKDRGVLKTGSGKILFIRNFVTESQSRGANIRTDLSLNSIGKDFAIRFGNQRIADFAIDPVFDHTDLTRIVQVRGGRCGKAALCDPLFEGEGFGHFLSELIECNGGKGGAFDFGDAILVLDLISTNLGAVGEGLLVEKVAGRRLLPTGLIISQ